MQDAPLAPDELSAAIDAVLPAALPRRATVAAGATHHARLLLAANERQNLTRVTAPRDLAIRHVLDSLLPWPRLLELVPEHAGAPLLLADLGSGGGYPGLLLALLLPHAQVVLIESIGKKAAFLREAAGALALRNVEVVARRGEEYLRERPAALCVARAVDSARELLRTLKPLRGRCGRLVLWKGPDAERELVEAAGEAAKQRLAGAITWRGELPDGAARCLLEYAPLDDAPAPGAPAAAPGAG